MSKPAACLLGLAATLIVIGGSYTWHTSANAEVQDKSKAQASSPVARNEPADASPLRKAGRNKTVPPKTGASPPHTEKKAPEPIRIQKRSAPLLPQLEKAYAAFQRGRIEAAEQVYDNVLHLDAQNKEALHGLAAIALYRQRPQIAAAFYRRALQADPKDALAMAALISLGDANDIQPTETRLKLSLREQPYIAATHLALGNIYAKQGLWRDAQQAFFDAHSIAPDNPDLAFNLAISLEHLHQARLAAQYYRKAINAAATQPSSFAQSLAHERLRILQAEAGAP